MNNGKELYIRLLHYVKPYRGKFALAVLGMVIFAATEPALPALMQPMLDGSFIEKDETDDHLGSNLANTTLSSAWHRFVCDHGWAELGL